MRLDVAAQRPRFTADEAVGWGEALYGLTAVAAEELPSDRDQNFLLKTAGGESAVLKIAGSAEVENVLDLQNQALLHLAGRAAVAGAVPRLHQTRGGAWMARVPGQDGQDHWVRLLSHLPGVPLGEVADQPAELLAGSGLLLGRLDAALLDFRHPAMGRRLHWDLAHAVETLAQYGPTITNPARRALVDGFAAWFVEKVTPRLPGLRRSVIHGDGNDYNILVSAAEAGPRRVTGLIDFGDMVYSATVFEPAIAAAYLMLDKEDPAAAATAVVSGYASAMPLSNEELSLLPALIAIRLCISVSLSAYQQTQEPENDYLSISERPAWELLARLAQMPPGLLAERLRTAVGEKNDNTSIE
ncbi:MAG: phosphotransferase [Candidatus Promineifilaceae bacterium]